MDSDYYERLNGLSLGARFRGKFSGRKDIASKLDAVNNCISKVAYWDGLLEVELEKMESTGQVSQNFINALDKATKHSFALAELLRTEKSLSESNYLFVPNPGSKVKKEKSDAD